MSEIDASELSRRAAKANTALAHVQNCLEGAAVYAAQCGAELNCAKALVPRGQWLSWLDDHFDGSRRTAQLYMGLASGVTWLDGDGGPGGVPHGTIQATMRAITAAITRRPNAQSVALMPAAAGEAKTKSVAHLPVCLISGRRAEQVRQWGRREIAKWTDNRAELAEVFRELAREAAKTGDSPAIGG